MLMLCIWISRKISFLKSWHSSGVIVSAFAISGTIFTCSMQVSENKTGMMFYLFMKTSHKFNIERLEPVSAWSDEVEADMNARIVDVNRSINPRLLIKIVIVLLVDIALDRLPAFVVINLKRVRNSFTEI